MRYSNNFNTAIFFVTQHLFPYKFNVENIARGASDIATTRARLADGSGPGPNPSLNSIRLRVGAGPGTDKSFRTDPIVLWVRPGRPHVTKSAIIKPNSSEITTR